MQRKDAPWTAGPAGAGSASSSQSVMVCTSQHAHKKQLQPSMRKPQKKKELALHRSSSTAT
eukprot:8959289-Ditylum_brightwellii.AAC.2